MPKSISKAQLQRAKERGMVVSSAPKKAVEKPAPTPAPPPVDNSAITAAADSIKNSAALMDTIRSKLEGMGSAPARAYRFTVNRDKRGFIESVDAVPVGDK